MDNEQKIMESHYDVVVIGAGPVGLTLALGLAQAGRSVLVLEKEPATSEHSRAPLIWPRTLEIFARLGVIDQFLEEGMVIPCIQLWDADQDRILLRLPLEELGDETAFPQLLIFPQSKTERLLYEALEREPTARVLFLAEALEIVFDEGHVEVRYNCEGKIHTVTSNFAAGCDGADSTVREVLRASFEGQTYGMKAALADIKFDQSMDLPFPRMSRRQGLATALRLDSEIWRVIVPRLRQGEIPLDEHIERAVANLFSTTDYKIVWQSEFDLHRRISSKFVDERVVLAGDAAHLRSPVGGEGMNVGIQDAEALQEVLAEALEEKDSKPFTGYVSQRRAAIEGGMFRVTDWLTQTMLTGSRPVLVVPAFRILGTLLRFRPLRRMLMRRLAMLDDPSREV